MSANVNGGGGLPCFFWVGHHEPAQCRRPYSKCMLIPHPHFQLEKVKLRAGEIDDVHEHEWIELRKSAW